MAKFPTFAQFRQFLLNNPHRSFEQNHSSECAMAICAGGRVSEGYASDIDMDAPAWFREFQERTITLKQVTGTGLLEVLDAVGPFGNEGGSPQFRPTVQGLEHHDWESQWKHLGKAIKESRKDLGLSRRALAHTFGCSSRTLAKVEGGCVPPPELAVKIASWLS